MATTFKKGNKGCFTCGGKDHLKRDCPKKANKKKLQEFALAAVEECNGPKTVNLNLILKESLFQETPNRGPPSQVLYNKNQGQILSFPSNPKHPALLPSIYQP